MGGGQFFSPGLFAGQKAVTRITPLYRERGGSPLDWRGSNPPPTCSYFKPWERLMRLLAPPERLHAAEQAEGLDGRQAVDPRPGWGHAPRSPPPPAMPWWPLLLPLRATSAAALPLTCAPNVRRVGSNYKNVWRFGEGVFPPLTLSATFPRCFLLRQYFRVIISIRLCGCVE